MTKYIDKSILEKEIKRQISAIDDYPKLTNTQIAVLEGDKVVLTKLLSFLDTLEVKEVDLEKEFDKCCENYTFDDECEVYTAKHFFELGFKAREKDKS